MQGCGTYDLMPQNESLIQSNLWRHLRPYRIFWFKNKRFSGLRQVAWTMLTISLVARYGLCGEISTGELNMTILTIVFCDCRL